MGTSFVMWGGFGGHNIGDEAILLALSRLIRKLQPTAQQYVLVRGEISSDVAEQYRNWDIEPVKVPSFRSLKVLSRSRLIAGGGQLVDDQSLGFPVGWTSLILLVNRALGQKPVILCIGAERVTHWLTTMLVKYCYSLAVFCACRDDASCEVLRSIESSKIKLYATRDVVFSLDDDFLPHRLPGSEDSRWITVVVSHDPRRTPRKSDYFSELIRNLLNAGCKVRLIAHDLRIEYDMGLLLQLETEYRNHPHVTFCKPQGVMAALDVYASSIAVISSRMHPLILAALVGSLPVAIPCTAKVRSLVGDLGIPILPSPYMPDRQGIDLLALISSKDECLRLIAARVSEFRLNVQRTTAHALTF